MRDFFRHSCAYRKTDRLQVFGAELVMQRLMFAILLAGALLGLAPAQAQDWYPADCCNAGDCAPVDKVVRLSSGGDNRLIVTSRHGTALVPVTLPYRESKDHRMHVCMRPSLYGGMGVTCIFMPPSSY